MSHRVGAIDIIDRLELGSLRIYLFQVHYLMHLQKKNRDYAVH